MYIEHHILLSTKKICQNRLKQLFVSPRCDYLLGLLENKVEPCPGKQIVALIQSILLSETHNTGQYLCSSDNPIASGTRVSPAMGSARVELHKISFTRSPFVWVGAETHSFIMNIIKMIDQTLTQSFTWVFGVANVVIYSNGSITLLNIGKVCTVPFRIFASEEKILQVLIFQFK